ncbi:hypothetical protein [Actinoallomurus acanthiterrae]
MRWRVSAFDVLLALLGAFLLYLVVPNVGPVLRAARSGAGTRGTFTADRLNCVRHPGHTACNWQGAFRSDSGTLTRSHVFLYGGAGGLTAGTHIRARDVGRSGQVYRPAGSHEWILSGLLGLGGLVLCLKGSGLLGMARPARASDGSRRPRTVQATAPGEDGSEPSLG